MTKDEKKGKPKGEIKGKKCGKYRVFKKKSLSIVSTIFPVINILEG